MSIASHIRMREGTVPTPPPEGTLRFWIDQADHMPKVIRPDGSVVSLRGPQGEPGTGGTGGGVTDHGDLTGLGDDDHTQYLTNARGDARYDATGAATAAQAYAVQRANHTGSQAIASVTGLQAALDAKTTPAYVDAAIAALVGSSPGTLDTLAEIAAALGSDPNLSTTLTTLIGTKLAKASNLSDLTNAGTARSNLGLAIGGDVQAYNANLTTWQGKTAPAGEVVGTTDAQTVSGKTFTSPIINVTSDATGDIYYRNAGGAFTRLAIDSNGKVLTIAGGLPSWATPSGGGGTDAIAGVVAKTADFTVTTGDKGKLFECTPDSTNPIVATLPSASTAGAGFWIWLRKAGTGNRVVLTSPVTLSLAYAPAMMLVWSDGANWKANKAGPNFSASTALRIEGGDNGAYVIDPGLVVTSVGIYCDTTSKGINCEWGSCVSPWGGDNGSDLGHVSRRWGSIFLAGNITIESGQKINLTATGVHYITFNGTVDGPVIQGNGGASLNSYNSYIWARYNTASLTNFPLEFTQVASGGTPGTNGALIYSKDVSGTASMFVKDEAGTESIISPHATDAPTSLYDDDEPFPQVTSEANDYLGVVRYVNHTRQREGRTNWEHRETFAAHNARLGLTGDRALVQLDWDAVQAAHVRDSEAERQKWEDAKAQFEQLHKEWTQRKQEADNAKLAFTEVEPTFPRPKPALYIAKLKPAWLTAAAARTTALTSSRASKGQLQGAAFVALKTSLANQLGITVNTPTELVGKMDDVIPAARSKRQAQTSTAARLQALEDQVEMLTQFVVFLSRK